MEDRDMDEGVVSYDGTHVAKTAFHLPGSEI